MALTVISDEVTGWIGDLVKKNCALEEEVKSLKSEVKTLTLKNEELMTKVQMSEHNENIGLEEVNPSVTKIDEELKCLKLENLELTVKFQLKKMWEFVLDELEKIRKQDSIYRKGSTPSPTKKEKMLDVISDQQVEPVATNPLEIERVVRILMGYASPKDLLTCRQVSKLWKDEVKQHMERKLTFHIYGSRLGQIKTFLNYASQSFPTFRNLKLDMTCDNWPRNKKILIVLLKKHGSFLHKLELNFGGVGFEQNWDLSDLRNIFLNCLEEIRELQIGMSCRLIHQFRMYQHPRQFKKIFVNLRTLNLRLNCTNCNFPAHHGKTQVFTDLLGLLPNLESLHWWSEDDSKYFIQSLLLINPPKLENLFFHSKIDLGFCELIANSELKLKQLYLINLDSFELHFVSRPGQSEVRPMLPVYSNQYDQYSGIELKVYLEDVLAQAQCGEEQMSCTKLLQSFISALDVLFRD